MNCVLFVTNIRPVGKLSKMGFFSRWKTLMKAMNIRVAVLKTARGIPLGSSNLPPSASYALRHKRLRRSAPWDTKGQLRRQL